MKKILISVLFLLTFSSVSVLSQNDNLENQPLFTDFVKVKNLKFPKEKCEFDNCFFESEEETKNFFRMCTPLLTKSGSIEIDSRGNTIVITDVKNHLNFISKFINSLDESKLLSNGLIEKQDSISEKLETRIIPIKNALPEAKPIGFSSCNFEYFAELIKPYFTKQGQLEIDTRAKTAIITDLSSNLPLLKFAINSFDIVEINELKGINHESNYSNTQVCGKN
jgi:type II secretory pathway component GspD/PulD (secretin)